jgi:hypothetical protein
MRALILAICLYVGLCCSLGAANWQGIQGSVDGGIGDQSWNAAAVQPDGTFVLAGTRQLPTTIPALEVYDLAGSPNGGGSILRIEPTTGLVLSMTQIPAVPLDLDLTPDGDLLVASRSISMKISAAGDTLLWRSGSADEIASDGQGGAWFSTRKGKKVTHVDTDGKVLHTFKAGQGFGIQAMTYLPKQELVVVAGGISRPSPIHVPYVHAHRHDGSMAWKMYDFPGQASVNAGDIADTIVQKMLVGPDGTLYTVAHSDGGATMWRHHPQKMAQKIPGLPVGHQGNQMYLAKRSNRIICLSKINPENGMVKKIAYITSWAHSRDKPDDKVASDQKAVDMAISPSGKLAVAGVSHGNIPWTKKAVHTSSFPIDTIGRYNNPVSAGEPYMIVLDAGLEAVS